MLQGAEIVDRLLAQGDLEDRLRLQQIKFESVDNLDALIETRPAL